ncbi:MAG: bifunctional DNA primase/polymerase, partial [PS1 clade bacterium]|nr:bifunctional DNA primase/polymerase [PS1 clade bacterium]
MAFDTGQPQAETFGQRLTMSPLKPTKDLVNAALEVADEFPVFPCDQNKVPVCSGGFKAATQDPDEIERLFSIKGAALIGIPTGEASGLSVIDIDVRDGKQGLEWEKKNAEILGLTKKAKTQSD